MNLRDLFSAKATAEKRKLATQYIREEAQKGTAIQLATSDHPDPLIAYLAHELGGMLRHPLAQTYLTHPPQLFVAQNPSREARAVSDNAILIHTGLIESLRHRKKGKEKLKAHVAHELAHIVLGHTNEQKAPLLLMFRRKFENEANLLGAVLCGDPRAMRLGMKDAAKDTLAESERQAILLEHMGAPTQAGHLRQSERRQIAKGSWTYPSLKESNSYLKNMEPPEGLLHVEQEMRRKLEKIHGIRTPG